MHELSPPESVHALDIDKLRQPDITFWTAWQGDETARLRRPSEMSRRTGK